MIRFHPLLSYPLKAALNDRVFWFFAALVAACYGLSFFMGMTALVEKGAFVIASVSSSLRLLGVLCMTLFIVNYLRRLHDSRDLEYLLARPVSKPRFVLCHAVSFVALSVFVAGALSFLMWPLPGLSLSVLLLWGGTYALELAALSLVAMFFAMAVSSAAAGTMLTLALYILGRMSGQLLSIVHHHSADGAIHAFLESAIQLVSVLLPRFDLMCQSFWLVYGQGPETPWILAAAALQTCIFGILILIATVIDLLRRRI